MTDVLLGLQIKMPTKCGCGDDLATIAPDDSGKYFARLKCKCGRGRGRLTEFTGRFIESIATKFGTPAAITIRASAIVGDAA